MISVVCPAFNEEKYICKVLDFFVAAEPPDKELFVIDGGSTDATRSIVLRYAQQHSNIQLLDNPEKYVPYALNKAIPHCRGEIIIRLDSHSEYDRSYFVEILNTFNKTDADIVGGPMRTLGNTPFQRAVGFATSTGFGVGNSSFHYAGFEGYTDSVYLGAWRKRVFNKVGLFDERMIRNQDDEFHYRAKSAGFKIYQNPRICVYYYPRDTPPKLFKQYFQYGLYKPLVLRKIRSEIKLRHLVPLGFVCYLFTLPLAVLYPFLLLPLGLYGVLAIYYSRKASTLSERLFAIMSFPIIHAAYGLGFMRGLFKR